MRDTRLVFLHGRLRSTDRSFRSVPFRSFVRRLRVIATRRARGSDASSSVCASDARTRERQRGRSIGRSMERRSGVVDKRRRAPALARAGAIYPSVGCFYRGWTAVMGGVERMMRHRRRNFHGPPTRGYREEMTDAARFSFSFRSGTRRQAEVGARGASVRHHARGRDWAEGTVEKEG